MTGCKLVDGIDGHACSPGHRETALQRGVTWSQQYVRHS